MNQFQGFGSSSPDTSLAQYMQQMYPQQFMQQMEQPSSFIAPQESIGGTGLTGRHANVDIQGAQNQMNSLRGNQSNIQPAYQKAPKGKGQPTLEQTPGGADQTQGLFNQDNIQGLFSTPVDSQMFDNINASFMPA